MKRFICYRPFSLSILSEHQKYVEKGLPFVKYSTTYHSNEAFVEIKANFSNNKRKCTAIIANSSLPRVFLFKVYCIFQVWEK